MNTNNPIKEDIVLKEYIDNGRGQAYVMQKAGVNLKELKEILEKNGYHLRNRHEAIIAANKSRNLLGNHNYFHEETANMAWLMGFLAADGSIEKNRNVIKISLSSVDKEILEKIRQEINLKSEVKNYITEKGFSVSKIQWSSEQHKKDLATYGIIPEKTFKLMPPYKLDKKYWIDYIRGYFDGDGSIVINPNNYNTLTWEIGSATKGILEFMRDYFTKEYNIPFVSIYETQRKEKFYLLMYSTNSAKALYNIMYYDENVLCLSRKKEKYTSLINNKIK